MSLRIEDSLMIDKDSQGMMISGGTGTMIGNFRTVIGQGRLLDMMIDRFGIKKIDIRGISDRNLEE
jgi:hypothetical protein